MCVCATWCDMRIGAGTQFRPHKTPTNTRIHMISSYTTTLAIRVAHANARETQLAKITFANVAT